MRNHYLQLISKEFECFGRFGSTQYKFKYKTHIGIFIFTHDELYMEIDDDNWMFLRYDDYIIKNIKKFINDIQL